MPGSELLLIQINLSPRGPDFPPKNHHKRFNPGVYPPLWGREGRDDPPIPRIGDGLARPASPPGNTYNIWYKGSPPAARPCTWRVGKQGGEFRQLFPTGGRGAGRALVLSALCPTYV